jgi:hypothetical protein
MEQVQEIAYEAARYLGNGEKISPAKMLNELEALGPKWRLESPHELYALVDYEHQNQHGAYTRDETIKNGPHWTSQETPWFSGGRVVVGFSLGLAYYNGGHGRAFARAVRVPGQ